MGAPAALDGQAVDLLRPRPALGGTQHEHRPARALRLAALARGALDAPNLADRPVERRSHLLVHCHGLIALDEARLPAAAAEEALDLPVAHAGEDGGVGDLEAVEVQNRQHRAVGDGVHELVSVPRGRKRSCLRLAVADHAGGDQIGIVRHRAKGVGEGVAQLAALVNGAGGLGRNMARDAAGERKALEELLHALLIAGDVGVDLGVAAVEPVLRDHGVAAVAGTGEVDHIEVVALDDAVQVRVDEVLARAGAPVADDGLLEVALFERALKQGVIEQVELAGGQVVRGAPVGIELPELLPVQRRLFGKPRGLQYGHKILTSFIIAPPRKDDRSPRQLASAWFHSDRIPQKTPSVKQTLSASGRAACAAPHKQGNRNLGCRRQEPPAA